MGKSMQYITFRLPSKTNEFKPEVYPPTPSNVPVWQNYTEWSTNATKPPNLFEFQEGFDYLEQPENASGWANTGKDKVNFTGAAAPSVNRPAQVLKQPARVEHPDKVRIKALEKQVADLKATLRISLTKPILGYWDIRGLGQSIRFLLKYLDVDFEDRTYRSEESKEANVKNTLWFKEKNSLGLDFPNLPYFCDTDGNKITEHLAICSYICDKYKPELNGRNVQERATVEMLAGVLFQLKKDSIMPMFSPETKKDELITLVYDKM